MAMVSPRGSSSELRVAMFRFEAYKYRHSIFSRHVERGEMSSSPAVKVLLTGTVFGSVDTLARTVGKSFPGFAGMICLVTVLASSWIAYNVFPKVGT